MVGRDGATVQDREPEPFRSGRGVMPPSTAQDFAQERVRGPAKAAPATRGWRHRVQTVTFNHIAPGPGAAERLERELIASAKTPIATSRRVSILSRKGGIGKTTTTLMLGHTFAMHRGDRVIALDANPDAGSLAYRVRRETDATVTQLMQAADRLHRYSDMRGFTSQSPTRLEVLASDDDPTISVALGENEYQQVLNVLERHYNLILMDTGTGILDPATQGILRMSDQIVVCAAPGIDASRASSLTLDWLDEHGYRDLVKDAVVVINSVRKNARRELESVTQHFARRCRAVVKVPWDPHLAEGLEVNFDLLRPDTRLAYLTASAAVGKTFALPSHRR
ncbi:MAG: MinD/ParA family protein [Candidatus Dormibacteria bacterium]